MSPTTIAEAETNPRHASLIQVDRALLSSRDSGFDLGTAAGEAVDNPIEASATIIRIRTEASEKRGYKGIHRISFADNGNGIADDILAQVLSLGFSTRYGKRDGLGRFGMGLKLAALSQGRRIDIYTKAIGTSETWHAYVDLDEVESGKQERIEAERIAAFPSDLAELMQDESGKPFSSGTLVVWSKIDRLHEGGKYGASNERRLTDLMKFLARAYRRFINQGIVIELNGKPVALYDPLFLLENPLMEDRFPKEQQTADVVESGVIEIDGQKVEYTVTVYPECLRRVKGDGGLPDKDPNFQGLHIKDNESAISILRNGREIYYAVIPRMMPTGKESGGPIDRFIGIEVEFPATLDEYFQVRNVKRGAEPVDKLREELRKRLKNPVEVARKRIRNQWQQTKAETSGSTNAHAAAQTAVDRAEQTAPRGRGGMKQSSAEQEEKIKRVVTGVTGGDDKNPTEAAELRKRIKSLPITIADASWPGKELLDIEHLNGNAIVTVNHRHPFIAKIYDDIGRYVAGGESEITTHADDVLALLERVVGAIDIMIMAYAKAENMDEDPDVRYEDLRSYWGQFLAAYTNELLKDI